MNGNITCLSAAAAVIVALTGCSGPSGPPQPGTPTGTSTSVTSVPATADSAGASGAAASPKLVAAPPVFAPPPPAASFEPYSVASGVTAAAAKECAALDVGREVFATIGKSTLRADSFSSSTHLVCVFGTDDDPALLGPNWLAVGTGKDAAPVYNASSGPQGGIAPQSISGLGDDARFYGAVRESGAGHVLFALKGSLLATVTANFKDVPAGADLSPARYGAIISKIYAP